MKTTHFHNYGVSTGWFYRLGKIVQADIVALYQSDTKDVHWLPWYFTTCTNITITRTGDTYAWCKNNIGIVRRMAEVRAAEARMIQTTP